MHRRDGKLILAATDLVGFLLCGHLTYLNRALLAGAVAKPDVGDDPALELLQRRGWAHEERYIELLQAEGRAVTRLDGSYERPTEVRVDETTAAMRRGDDVIFQATVFDGQWVGHPDFLLRVGMPGDLGRDHHYDVADTKLAHSAKASALLQICSYVAQVERIQGVRPERVYVVTGGAKAEPHEFRTAELMAYFRHAKADFEAVLERELDLNATYPDPVEHCAVCRWSRAQCRPRWRTDDALPLVAGITRRQRTELQSLGVATRGALAAATIDKRFDRVHEQARVQVGSDGLEVPIFRLIKPEPDGVGGVLADRGLTALPEPAAGDLFFDIEGDPFAFWEGLEYLFGVWNGAEYRSFWALTRQQEKEAFERIIDLFHERLAQHPTMHVYHYGVYEPSRLKRLAGLHSTREEELDRLLRGRVFVDLYRVVRQGLFVGSERYSIKNLEPLYGYNREIELRDANSSIVEFEKVLEQGDPSGELKEAIAGYNRDDCVSTQRLRDWLEQRRLQAAREFEIELPRPPAGDQRPPSEDLTERIRAVREMTARLTDGIDKDPGKQSPADKATWLVAHLLDWHRREDKSTWWRYFDLMSKSDEELIDEAEPIGGLVHVDTWELGGRARSNIHRYRFPAQDYRVDLGNSLNDPALFAAGQKTGTGTVAAIDDDARTIDIKRGREWAGAHPTSVVVLDVIDAKAQRTALMRLGEWVAAKGIDSPDAKWQAGRDLLCRRPPRLIGGTSGDSLLRAGESGTGAARRLALQLEGTTLAIQGPPGSGKTYTGARMIVDIVREAQRSGRPRPVGISSNSHKVIGNLLAEVLFAAEEEDVAIRALQKAKEHEAYRHPAVQRVGENDEVDEAIAGGSMDVVCGTPWLWARAEMANVVDTLFVDEAGQVSLANVIAMSGAARNVVLLGDPQQLDQPTQGVHPEGAGVSALGHFLGDAKTVPEDRGLFLEHTYRMHPQITEYTSNLFYEGKLESVAGLERQSIVGDGLPEDLAWLAGSGLRWVPVEHDGNTNESEAEASRVVDIVQALIGRDWVDGKGVMRVIGPNDIRVVSPFNAHRLLIDRLLGEAGIRGVQVGTVDKFQGQQAAVSIYTMATSRAEDAPRGLSFLYSLHRLNVATSRAKALAIIVASGKLLAAVPRTPDELRMVNGLCAFVEAAPAPPVDVSMRAEPEVAATAQLTLPL